MTSGIKFDAVIAIPTATISITEEINKGVLKPIVPNIVIIASKAAPTVIIPAINKNPDSNETIVFRVIRMKAIIPPIE